MAVPKHRTSPGRKRRRRSHHALKNRNMITSEVTGEKILHGTQRGHQYLVERDRLVE